MFFQLHIMVFICISFLGKFYYKTSQKFRGFDPQQNPWGLPSIPLANSGIGCGPSALTFEYSLEVANSSILAYYKTNLH